MDKETQMIVDKLDFFRDVIVHHDEYKTQDLIHWLAVAGDMIEELADVKEQLAGMEIMLTCAQSAAETWERKCRRQCSWISVEEKLPEESEDVLVFCRNDNTTWNTIAHRVRTLWWRSGVPIESVTHWMPLPEPPEE